MKGKNDMSMTINNHLSNSIQDTRATSAEKLGQKGKTAEVGKTQESSISASLDQVNMGEDGVAITEVSRQRRPEKPEAQKHPAVPHTDRVEISAEGQAASAKRQKQQADTEAAEGERYKTEDLSAYTATELKQMYYRGEITRQEYEEETGKMLE